LKSKKTCGIIEVFQEERKTINLLSKGDKQK